MSLMFKFHVTVVRRELRWVSLSHLKTIELWTFRPVLRFTLCWVWANTGGLSLQISSRLIVHVQFLSKLPKRRNSSTKPNRRQHHCQQPALGATNYLPFPFDYKNSIITSPTQCQHWSPQRFLPMLLLCNERYCEENLCNSEIHRQKKYVGVSSL